MTKVIKMLAGGGLAAGLGVLLLGFTGAFGAHEAEAQSPPTPPARFAGSVTVDGKAVPAGTVITATIGSVSCGVTSTFNQGAEARYVMDVPALNPSDPGGPKCGADNSVITFTIGGTKAKETGSWVNSQLNILNLTATSNVTPTPAPGTGPTATVPKPPTTGNLGPSESGNSLWLYIALASALVAFGVSGAAVTRKSR